MSNIKNCKRRPATDIPNCPNVTITELWSQCYQVTLHFGHQAGLSAMELNELTRTPEPEPEASKGEKL